MFEEDEEENEPFQDLQAQKKSRQKECIEVKILSLGQMAKGSKSQNIVGELQKLQMEILEDGRIVIAGQQQLLAGSSLETDSCVSNAIQMGGVSLCEAIDMAGRNPARLLGFEEIRLRRDSRADLILFHYAGVGNKLEFVATMAAGVVRFGEIPSL